MYYYNLEVPKNTKLENEMVHVGSAYLPLIVTYILEVPPLTR